MVPRGSGCTFWPVFVLLALGATVASTMMQCNGVVECTPETSHGSVTTLHCKTVTPNPLPPQCEFASTVQFVSYLVSIVLLVILRQNVRALYRIPPSCCGECEDLCCAWCCWPLATCQLFRHLGAREGTRYKIFSTTGAASAYGSPGGSFDTLTAV